MNALLLFAALAATAQLLEEETVQTSDYAPCGLNSFFLVCRLLDVPLQWDEARELLGSADSEGMHTFAQIARASDAVGLFPIGLQTNLKGLQQLPMPAILQVRDPSRARHPPHFLVLVAFEAGQAILLDPPGPEYTLYSAELDSVWTGNVLVFPRSGQEADELRSGAWTTLYFRAGILSSLIILGLALGILGKRHFVSRPRSTAFQLSSFSALWSRRVILRLVGISFLLAAILSFAWKPTPHLAIVESELVFDELLPGSHHIQVPVSNQGRAPILISRIQSSCTCASVTFPEKLSPGESSVIDVDLRVSRGPQRAVLLVDSNDPGGPQRITIWWHGQSRPVLHPVYISGTVPADKPYQRSLKVIFPGGKDVLDVDLVRVVCASPYVSIIPGSCRRVAKQVGNAVFGELELHLSVRPPARSSYISLPCELEVRQGEKTYRLGFFLALRFLGDQLRPEAPGLVFSGMSRSELVGQTRQLRVGTSGAPGPIFIRGLPSWLACEQHPEADGQQELDFRIVQPPIGTALPSTIALVAKGDSGPGVPIDIYCITAP